MMRLMERQGLKGRSFIYYVCEECRMIGVPTSLKTVPASCPGCGWGTHEKRRWYQRVYRKKSR